eukprot:CAMPEP_0184651208 /NCGR_PEP_ID=MMETSP0308-20130426/8795_1 /TAXON_ID=38269 /ORGANISM="Gloeochaete witrockiana, Strain SAG 46.84" /LENGTH=177 /DNA_ID=CAMNT_0027085263 /DNA_START=205 /DNA_END=738 /DNA_ORIENTATION=+
MRSQLTVPDFPDGLDWLNVQRPLSIHRDLRDKIVILDFWTHSSASCLKVQSGLASLEDKYRSDPVAFVGVHSGCLAKDLKNDTKEIRETVLRHDICHPIVNDVSGRLVGHLGVSGCPTFGILGPWGNFLGLLYEQYTKEENLDVLIDCSLHFYDRYLRMERMHPTPIPIALEKEKGI